MKVLFLAESDYGNSGRMFMKAATEAGHECRGFCARPHLFNYGDELTPLTLCPQTPMCDGNLGITFQDFRVWAADLGRRLHAAIGWADLVHVVQSDLPVCLGGEHPHRTIVTRDATMALLRDKAVVLQNGGSYYRNRRRYYEDEVWAGVADAAISHEADLMGTASWPETLILPPIDPEEIAAAYGEGHPKRRAEKKIVIGHYPGNIETKGTRKILDTLTRLGRKRWFRDNFEVRRSAINFISQVGVVPVPWREHLKRLAGCHVVIDQIQPYLDDGRGGKVRFGEWCNTALESAALGCEVITNSWDPDPYVETYGVRPALTLTNDAGPPLARAIRNIYDRGPRGAHARNWALAHHTPLATAWHIDKVYKEARAACTAPDSP